MMKVSKEAGSDELWLGDKFPKDLPVQLTDKEREERAKDMSGAQIELTGLEEEKKETLKDFAARMKPLQELVRNLAPVVNTGIEQRPVPTRWRQELGGSSAVLVRLDTFEVLEDTRRALNPAELEGLQSTLGFGRSGRPAPEETPSSLIDEALSQGDALGRTEKATPLIMPGHGPDSQPVGRGTTDYRKAPVNANRGAQMCETEEEHEYGKPDPEGWASCRKCPADRRIVATATLYDGPVREPGEVDMSSSQATLDALDDAPPTSTLRWPLGDTMWLVSIDGDQLWFHSPDTASSSSRKHGPAGWAPGNDTSSRVLPWTVGGQELAEVPGPVVALAEYMLSVGAEGLVPPRSMFDVKADIAAERTREMAQWDEEAAGQMKAAAAEALAHPATYLLGDDMLGWTLEVERGEHEMLAPLLWLCGEGHRWPFSYHSESGVLLPNPGAVGGLTLDGFDARHKPMLLRAEEMCRNGTVAELRAPPASTEAPGADLTDLAAAFLIVLLDGPLTLEAIRSKTTNRRAGTTAKSLIQKGFVADYSDPSRYTLTPAGRQTAELLKKAKESRKGKA
jgi:hypothetical protein